MNALEVIDSVRSYGADLVVEQNKLIIRGRGDRLPEDVRAAVKRHKAEILIALGAPYDTALAEILDEIRPHLPPPLKLVPDSHLIVLVNFSIMHALGKAVDEVARS